MKLFTVTDDKGRKIECVLEHTIPIDGVDYMLLTPNDTPVVLVRVGEGDGDDELLEDFEESFESAKDVLAAADICLAEHDLTLVRSAVTLTVAGKLLPVEEEDVEDIEIEDDTTGETNLFELLIPFLCDGQEYGLYVPLDPFFVVARVTGDNEGVVVTGDEFERIQPIIEAKLDRREQDA
jgi:hypothetical protein